MKLAYTLSILAFVGLVGCSDTEYQQFVCQKTDGDIVSTLNVRASVQENHLDLILGHAETSTDTTVHKMNKISEERVSGAPSIVRNVYENDIKKVQIYVDYNTDTNDIVNFGMSNFDECQPYVYDK